MKPGPPQSLAPKYLVAILPVLALEWTTLPAAAAGKVTAGTGQIDLPTYGWSAVKHPYFRGTDNLNIYPYPMLDFLSREKTNRTYHTVFLENEFLSITFLPELGGKIFDVIDRTSGQPMFYVNHVVKPGLIGQCGAWTSGGVEWNTGPQGHTVGCMQPMEVEVLPAEKDGSRSVAVGETERIYGTKWTVVVTLRPGRAFIEERIRIYNPTETIRPYYFWNCTAEPNTPGFRFIYPMLLGCDHAGDKFFDWPIDHGKDLSRGANYQDASSIFAWYCDQDFFGSYNDDLGRGVVAYANHYQLPGKKAWTWGHGSFGTMHQADLTDSDGPYNEVQTGPLLTQAQVGRLDPCEAVEWKEWWYPIHCLGGFTFANKNVAANTRFENGELRLGMLGSGTWPRAQVMVNRKDQTLAQTTCRLDPAKPVELALAIKDAAPPFEIGITSGKEVIARWQFPLDLPARKPPEKKPTPESASELVAAGWQEFLFGRFAEAEKRFNQALEKDSNCRDAHVGLAHLNLDRDCAKAAEEARAALAADPDSGPAHYVLAVAESRLDHATAALDEAWKATLDPATAIASRALVARLALRQHRPENAVAALTEPGPWQTDPVCRNHLAVALRQVGQPNQAKILAGQNLGVDPLDGFARGLLRQPQAAAEPEISSPSQELAEAWPSRYEQLAPLERAVQSEPLNGKAALRLGHLLFHLGRHKEGREMWKRAAESGADPVIAYRALGMAAKTLDNDLKAAREWLEKANQSDNRDAIVARDLGKVLFDLADKTTSDTEKHDLTIEARDRLKTAFEAGKGRSDFVALLARAQNGLGEYAETARMLDGVRVTIWEGAHEVHDLFEQAHLALAEAQLKAGRPRNAMAELNRALEYPANLATGKLENTPEAHIHYLRGNALAALDMKQEAAKEWKLAADEPEAKDTKIQEARQKAKEALEKLGQ
jgi:tetratricopeptide (TPR) repeat protein